MSEKQTVKKYKPSLDGSAMIPDELIKGYINHLSWSDKATDREKALVTGNIRSFAVWLRTNMYGIYTPIYKEPNTPCELDADVGPEGKRITPDMSDMSEKNKMNEKNEIEQCGTCRHFRRGHWYPKPETGSDEQCGGHCKVICSVLRMTNTALTWHDELYVLETFGCRMYSHHIDSSLKE